MRIEYSKLVRDRIPEVIREAGRGCGTKLLSQAEYVAALREKLVEKAREPAVADVGELVGELGDILELAEALMAVMAIDPDAVRTEQTRKREEHGGYVERIYLLWTQ